MKVIVEVDAYDILDEMGDDDFIREAKNRDLHFTKENQDTDHDVCEIRVLIERKDWQNVMAMFDRTFDVDGSRK